MTVRQPITLTHVIVATEADVVDRTFQIKAALSPDVGMALLAVVGGKRGMLERHQKPR